jgi:murein DD-endopeptidase MepM/ murein hydrolase activator NlpD
MVPALPIPAYLAGKRALVYELHITNLGAGPLRIMAIDVYRAGGGVGARPGAGAVVTPAFGAPLRGGVWLAAGPSNGSDHRRSVTAIRGRAYLAQRFAIDWQKLGPNENTYHGDGHHNDDYWSYGEPVRSVAPGEVIAALDTVHENTPHAPLPRMPFANLSGNFVTVRIAGNRYVTYAHLRLGSVRVRVHEHVAAGQLLGLLGNSGQATAPHLHFQVTDGPSVLGAEGVPFRLTTFRHVGFGATYEPGAKHEDVLYRGEMPADDEIVRLPSRPPTSSQASKFLAWPLHETG